MSEGPRTIEDRIADLENRATATEWVLARVIERIAAGLPDGGEQLRVDIEDQARRVEPFLDKDDQVMLAAAAFLGRLTTELGPR